jgi:hypothetical protein
MDTSSDKKLFRSSDLSLVPYLSLQGLEYLGTELDPNDPKKILFVFSDPHGKAVDLTILFQRSESKIYHSLWSFYRSQLAAAKRGSK